MIRAFVSLDETAAALNRLLKADSQAMRELIETRQPFSLGTLEKVEGLQGILVYDGHEPAEYVGFLGVINSLFGEDEKGNGAIAAVYSADDGLSLTGFSVIRRPKA